MSTYGQGKVKIFPQKSSMELKPRIFSPANLSPSTVSASGVDKKQSKMAGKSARCGLCNGFPYKY